ncbi:DNA glycosylase AlkZ-like family protein [Actinomarinicola tropica]|uniref:DNA glycosylase AlkZ-like family protein n=1 Tax=Actinomarinicola tropica TaxID=2789776 RepID=UPI001E64E20C|nr:crosslink repair DNA glycosylase YcaQ family protein [Actinomarinicola tropica]
MQDTGTDGAAWALELRGHAGGLAGLVLAWTLRGAPHAYRATDLAQVAVATAPLSEADAAKRVFDGSRPLTAAGIPVLEALAEVAAHEREAVARPIVKGEVSARLAEELPEPFLRWCRPCRATHLYEQVFRLPALQAGLVLEPGTSPPVMRRQPRFRPPMFARLGGEADPRFDVIRGHLRAYPGARVRDAATFLDAPMKEVRAHWPDDAVEVALSDEPAARAEPRFVLAEDLDLVAAPPRPDAPAVRLLGPYDPYLQCRDREVLVADSDRRAALWPVIGRPGAVVVDGAVVGSWRPTTKGSRLTLRTEMWERVTRRVQEGVEAQAERLAAHRGLTLKDVVPAG